MEISFHESEELRRFFTQKDSDGDGMLEPDDLDQLFGECGIDQQFGPALHRVLAKNKKGVSFDDVLNFFSILVSGKTRAFYRYVFEAMDLDGDGELGRHDIMQFAGLMNESLNEDEAGMVLTDCGGDPNGSIRFDHFWGAHQSKHGFQSWEEEEDDSDSGM
jgi:Ca2+-binding EF-hand superfamily protein